MNIQDRLDAIKYYRAMVNRTPVGLLMSRIQALKDLARAEDQALQALWGERR